jgi:hypothetical protein
MISGAFRPDQWWGVRVVWYIGLGVCFAPWVVIGAGLIWVGILGLFRPAGLGELWFCLPVGVVMLSILGYLLYSGLYRTPRRTILEFRYADGVFAYRTQETLEMRSRPASELREVRAMGEAKGGTRNYFIRFQNGECMFLNVCTENADLLVQDLRQQLQESAARACQGSRRGDIVD